MSAAWMLVGVCGGVVGFGSAPTLGAAGGFHAEHVIVRTRAPQGDLGRGSLAALDARAGVVAVEYESKLVPGLRCVRVLAGEVDRAIAVYAADPAVLYADRDHEVRVCDQDLPWGIAAVNAPPVWAGPGSNAAPISRGAGVIVGVLDTGFDFTNPDLPVPVATASFVPGEDAQDVYTHATHVSGTILALDNAIGVVGVAPSASIVSGKVIASNGVGYESWVAAGIDWAVQQGVRVINMSIGGPDFDQGMQDSCDAALAQGTLVVAAAGNDNSSALFYPADFASVMAVAAVDSGLTKAWFSNFGPAISVCAPGVSVESVVLGGALAWYSGTSMASPHTAGVAALLFGAFPTATPTQVRRAIEESATDLGAPGRDDLYGHGFINAQAARDRLACILAAPALTRQPPTSTCGGLVQHLSLDASGAGTLAYQWQVQDGPAPSGVWRALGPSPITLACGATVGVAPAGAAAVEMSVTPCAGGGPLQMRCVVGNACGSVTSGEVALAARPCMYQDCPADFDGSGGTPDVGDTDAFFADWLAGAECADTDCSGGTPDAGDIDAFFALWLAGGC